MDKKVKVLKEEEITFKRKTLLSLNEAANLLDMTRQNMHQLATKYDLGRKIAGNYKIDPLRLKKFIDCNRNIFIGNQGNTKKFDCLSGFRFGIDYDLKTKCKKCDNEIWLRCGEKYDKRLRAKSVIKNTNRAFDKKEMEDKIKEMEERL